MKCWKCGKENNEGSSSCIYCSSSLIRPEPVTEAGRAMRALYDHYGPEDVLSNSAYLVNGLGDLLEDSKKLKNQLKMAADAGIFRLYKEQLAIGYPDPGFDKRVRLLMTEDAGLSEKAASELAGYFDEMIGWRFVKGTDTGETDSQTWRSVIELLDIIERYDLEGSESGAAAAELYRAQVEDLVEQEPALAGMIYLHYYVGYKKGGHVIPKNHRKADQWLRKGAELSDPDCMYYLALSYHKGNEYVQRNSQEAMYWAKKALSLKPDDPQYKKLLKQIEEGKRKEEQKQGGTIGNKPDDSGSEGGSSSGTQSTDEKNVKSKKRSAAERNKQSFITAVIILAIAWAIFTVFSMVHRRNLNSQFTSGTAGTSAAVQSTQSTQNSSGLAGSTGKDKQTYTLRITGGTILVEDGDSFKNVGSSYEMSEGSYFKLQPEPDDNGYNFTEFVATEGLANHIGTITETARLRMPAENVSIEAVYEPWILIDWIPVIFHIDDLFCYGGKHLLEMDQADMIRVYDSLGIQYYTEKTGKKNLSQKSIQAWVSDNITADLDNATTFYWLDGTGALNNTISATWASDEALPDSCPLRIGDSYNDVCTKIGATADMANDLLEIEEKAKATNRGAKTHYYGSDYQVSASLELKGDGRKVLFITSKQYLYQFWFDAEDSLYHIHVSDTAS